MAKDVIDIFREAATLPDCDRATLAGLLIASLDGEPEPGVEAAWAEEIERRGGEIESGAVKTVAWETVRQRLLDRLNAR